jgi:putative methanogenesis marker 16 metalloprotein
MKKFIENDEKLSFEEVDVVTTGTCGIMSGTAAILHIGVSEPGEFKKAKAISLNGVPAFPGPCPNELLGSVDLIVYGTKQSINDPNYGGGFLFKDILEGKEINVEVESIEGKKIEATIDIEDISRGEMIGSRMAFKNYTAFTNPSGKEAKSIFSGIPMKGKLNQFSFSGCGEYNPLENDPHQEIINEGKKVLLNGSQGRILGNGTRSTAEKPNLMLSANLLEMDSEYLGGFKTGAGPEIYDTIAIPIPILNEEIFNNLFIRDNDITLPVADIHGRHLPISEISYEEVWKNTDSRPIFVKDTFDPEKNKIAKNSCPTNAINDNGTINMENCFGCGLCSILTNNKTYKMNLGTVDLDIDNEKHNIPITCRQSDRQRAKKLTSKLKDLILKEIFEL